MTAPDKASAAVMRKVCLLEDRCMCAEGEDGGEGQCREVKRIAELVSPLVRDLMKGLP